ncbi:general secretion pathway protein GspM [Burkholderia sp. WAC0059]|uniref:type II secretion system protein GspM n=1 Tax=Burkholderia sp. WAC0059 TaxID=2066022 RepID=UPI000C7F19D1|nr:type II secretion system protein GspM [Burkholderia sp. WAC0059]PLZ01742.1 general secretion pathway protein GspM [Burkholderia sp. WAC0059]
MDTRIRNIATAISGWLESRAPRERKLLVAGVSVGLIALVYNVLWTPAWDGSRRIYGDLPALQGGLAQLRAQAVTARSFRGASAIRPLSGIALRDALSALLKDAGIPDPKLVVVGQGVQMDAKGVPFNVWMTWLEVARTKLHVRVAYAHAEAEAHPGMATVSATLQPPEELQ